ncbi:hypothetical protein [Gordonia hydrophobica]|uniref:DUF1508 domain-containing protein n=1 Tax=Gordonia hydrophobica TaxID=40516 RepID=A0ABZ2U3D8_9ACTN|nr:hypothetical protein [Gordonia hydrophobica]MBM7367516.1 hypothetical protein [Gordonia hydrophobica]
MNPTPREVTYTDELLADGTVYRRYADGRQEWRTRTADGRVEWRDEHGRHGVDEPLGPKLVKRTDDEGYFFYGRENGFGRTLWSDGRLTVNRSKIGGRLGMAVAGLAGAAILGPLIVPPDAMSFADEEALRAMGTGNSGGDGGGGDGGYSPWDDGDGGFDGGDFG